MAETADERPRRRDLRRGRRRLHWAAVGERVRALRDVDVVAEPGIHEGASGRVRSLHAYCRLLLVDPRRRAWLTRVHCRTPARIAAFLQARVRDRGALRCRGLVI